MRILFCILSDSRWMHACQELRREFQLREGRSARPPRGQSRRQLRVLRRTTGELPLSEPRRPALESRWRLGSRQTGRYWGRSKRARERAGMRTGRACCVSWRARAPGCCTRQPQFGRSAARRLRAGSMRTYRSRDDVLIKIISARGRTEGAGLFEAGFPPGIGAALTLLFRQRVAHSTAVRQRARWFRRRNVPQTRGCYGAHRGSTRWTLVPRFAAFGRG
jgi:hypothetical protein